MACCSRDFLAGPLRDLIGVINNVKDGKFDPDAPASGRMVMDPVAPKSPVSDASDATY